MLTTTNLIVLRNALVTRCSAARVIARNKGRTDLCVSATLLIAGLKRAFDNEVPAFELGVADLERGINRAGTMDQVRETYAAHLRAVHGLRAGRAA